MFQFGQKHEQQKYDHFSAKNKLRNSELNFTKSEKKVRFEHFLEANVSTSWKRYCIGKKYICSVQEDGQNRKIVIKI